MDKRTLIGLQTQLLNQTRTHDNDLVAMCFAFDDQVSSRDILSHDTPFDDYITYTFMWGMPMNELESYQYPGLKLKVRRCKSKDDSIGFVALFTGTLSVWIQYCKSDMPKRFTAAVREQLERDGYGLRLQ